jgi:hypothetical protein
VCHSDNVIMLAEITRLFGPPNPDAQADPSQGTKAMRLAWRRAWIGVFLSILKCPNGIEIEGICVPRQAKLL